MNTVAVPWIDMTRPAATARALEMNSWCRSQGLVRDIDFDWYFNHGFRETRFRFFGEYEQFATMFALKWISV